MEDIKREECQHVGEKNTETSKVDGHIDYYVCVDCGKIVEKYIINDRERWI